MRISVSVEQQGWQDLQVPFPVPLAFDLIDFQSDAEAPFLLFPASQCGLKTIGG